MKKLLTLAAMATLAVTLAAAPALAADSSYKSETTISKDNDGDYKAETTTKAEDAAGTETKSDDKVDVDVSANGDVEKTTTHEASTDPKGLFNKSKVKVKDVVKKKGAKVTKKHKKEVNGDTVEESETTTDQSK